MPADRFIHPRLGHSHKVNLLTDLEFRVWVQYMLSADDFGVMRYSAVTLQAGCDALASRKGTQVERCLTALIKAGLLRVFEHQGRKYVYQHDWQEFQKVEYPRPTFEPKPPADCLDSCDEKTRALFLKHPGGTPKRVPKIREASSENLEVTSQENPDYARAHPRETAKANGSMANGSWQTAEARGTVADDVLGNRARNLIERYKALYSKHRNGARLKLLANSLEFHRALELCQTWAEDERLDKMAVILLTTDEEWVSSTDRGFGVFASRASWCDERLAAWEAKQKGA